MKNYLYFLYRGTLPKNYTVPGTNNKRSENRPFAPKGNNCIPTINFQELLRFVSRRVSTKNHWGDMWSYVNIQICKYTYELGNIQSIFGKLLC